VRGFLIDRLAEMNFVAALEPDESHCHRIYRRRVGR
jgi:hypothetical protein